MKYILNIETSSRNCSVAIGLNGSLIDAVEEKSDGFVHGERLHLLISDLLKKHGIGREGIAAVAVGAGPGSYTGLRIGVATAKGLAYSWSCPLISVDTLKTMAAWAVKDGLSGFLMPMIDARRMEVYTALYGTDLDQIEAVSAEVIEEDYQLEKREDTIHVFGDGAEKTLSIIGKDVEYTEGIEPSARFMVQLAEVKYQKGDFEDIAYFEPNYLKSFQAGKPKKVF